uniref:Uncharacterized protein n=1 Tax=Chromera velia CCMP2878 TaxID=1169474 RepID=A0A0K6S8P9_9ALVE|eukprot:Cvel_6504.t1-p1 / transcript=Cvel_6504.t1 / gene=Cvel_6504 / organism=Chromera_velia_CCMP2878 / gene_product=hypothetical protein / transcript_product=hypothetical protein / location=Cvel_scaffold319:53899-58872(+) / protein_length=596 / sequence_SO=supercontig / SO=protein_coding / is_pseudo=false
MIRPFISACVQLSVDNTQKQNFIDRLVSRLYSVTIDSKLSVQTLPNSAFVLSELTPRQSSSVAADTSRERQPSMQAESLSAAMQKRDRGASLASAIAGARLAASTSYAQQPQRSSASLASAIADARAAMATDGGDSVQGGAGGAASVAAAAAAPPPAAVGEKDPPAGAPATPTGGEAPLPGSPGAPPPPGGDAGAADGVALGPGDADRRASLASNATNPIVYMLQERAAVTGADGFSQRPRGASVASVLSNPNAAMLKEMADMMEGKQTEKANKGSGSISVNPGSVDPLLQTSEFREAPGAAMAAVRLQVEKQYIKEAQKKTKDQLLDSIRESRLAAELAAADVRALKEEVQRLRKEVAQRDAWLQVGLSTCGFSERENFLLKELEALESSLFSARTELEPLRKMQAQLGRLKDQLPMLLDKQNQATNLLSFVSDVMDSTAMSMPSPQQVNERRLSLMKQQQKEREKTGPLAVGGVSPQGKGPAPPPPAFSPSPSWHGSGPLSGGGARKGGPGGATRVGEGSRESLSDRLRANASAGGGALGGDLMSQANPFRSAKNVGDQGGVESAVSPPSLPGWGGKGKAEGSEGDGGNPFLDL